MSENLNQEIDRYLEFLRKNTIVSMCVFPDSDIVRFRKINSSHWIIEQSSNDFELGQYYDRILRGQVYSSREVAILALMSDYRKEMEL